MLARRYAKALFSIGEERGSAEALLAEVDTLCQTAELSEESRRALFTPLYPRSERRGLIGALAVKLELSAEVRAFAMLLVDENRTALLPLIAEALRDMVERASGRVRATVVSAAPLSDEQRERLAQALAQRLGAAVDLEVEVDPELLGGLVVRVGDLLLDGSLRTQLGSLASSLRKGPA